MVNILLLLLVFGATRWKKQPYAGVLVLAAIKGALYFIVLFGRAPLWAAILNGVIGLIVFGGLAFGMVYFIRRLDRYEPKELSYSSPGAERVVFKWEYLLIALFVLLIIFGEMLFALGARGRG